MTTAHGLPMTSSEVLSLLVQRRSLARMLPEAPDRALIEQLLTAAVHAPNHHDTQPWRFFVLSDTAREEFASVLAESARRRMAGEDEQKIAAKVSDELRKPLRSPVLIIVAATQDPSDRVRSREDFQATNAAIENILIAAYALGLAAIWRTGDGVFDPYINQHFGLDEADVIAGVIYLGYPDPAQTPLRPRERSFEQVTQWRGHFEEA